MRPRRRRSKLEETKGEENREEETKEGEGQNKEHSQGQKKIVTSVVVEKVDENDATQKELVSKDVDVDISPLVRRKPESPLDPGTEKCDDSCKKIAAETVVASESIEEATVQFAESPDESFENNSEEFLEEKEEIIPNPGEDENAKEGVMDFGVREDVGDQVLEEDSHQAEQSNEEKIGAEERCQVETSLISPEEESEDSEVVQKEEEESTVE